MMATSLDLIDQLLPCSTSTKPDHDDIKQESMENEASPSLYQMKNEIEKMEAKRLKHKLLCYIYAQLLNDKDATNQTISDIFISPSQSYSEIKRKHFSAAFDLQNIVNTSFNINLDIDICLICAEYSYAYSLEGKWSTTFGLMEIKNNTGYYGLSKGISTSNKTITVTEYDHEGSKVKGTWGRRNSSDNGVFEFTFTSSRTFNGIWYRPNDLNLSPGKWIGKRIEDDENYIPTKQDILSLGH